VLLSFFLAVGIVAFIVWLVILLSGFGLSALAVISGIVYYVRHQSNGLLARAHLALTVVVAVGGIMLLVAAISFALWLSMSSR